MINNNFEFIGEIWQCKGGYSWKNTERIWESFWVYDDDGKQRNFDDDYCGDGEGDGDGDYDNGGGSCWRFEDERGYG